MRKVCTTLLCALVGYAAGLGAQENPDVRFAASDAGGRMSFTGDDIRVGIGIDDDGDAHGEYFHVFGEQETSAWIAEGWVADDRGGIKLNFHFLTGAESLTEAATSDDVHVTKFFVAADRNEFDDRKITAGLGMESERLFWGAYLMRRITGRRLIDTTIDQTIDVSNFTDMGQVFEQQTITDDITRLYERAYDFGVGGRIGHFYEDSLIRVRGGLDYETGRFGADQYTLSLGLEKYFANTGHSLALTAEYLDKSGDFEVDSSDTRALLFYRYSFGERYQPRRDALETRTMSAPPMREVTRIEKRPVRNRIEISEEAYFGFDSAAVGGEARQDLEALAARIAATEIVDRVTITGHTCDLGPAAYNQGLSERRAASARDFLAAAGLDDTLLVTRGRGESNPRYPNDGEDNRRLNRRVEIEFVSLEAGFEDVEVTVEEPDGDGVRWTRQAIDDPAWIDRALRNPVAHKRIVDTYRFAETERVVTENEPFVVNNLPVASDDASTTRREMPVTIAVLANDSDPDGGPLRVVSVTAPASGTATVEGGAMVTYAPNPGFAGIDSFSYLIVDDFGSEASA
ncbi:MAG: Ig-like domain-containing protein, partial [Pseudomonadota bacterium]